MTKWNYEGKRVVIAGCVSGMGEATAKQLVELGAEVHGFDIRESGVEMASFQALDLRDPSSIKVAVSTIDGQFDALFNCVGVWQTFPAMDVMKVNFIGLRLWTELLIPKIRSGGAICSISSVAGMAWATQLPECKELISRADFDSAVEWVRQNPEPVADGYSFSKAVLNVWTMIQGTHLIKKNVRINCTLPGPTQTRMMLDFEKAASRQLINVFAAPSNRRASPEEQAAPIVFLNSDAATYINGHCLPVDGGFLGAVGVGEIDIQALLANGA